VCVRGLCGSGKRNVSCSDVGFSNVGNSGSEFTFFKSPSVTNVIQRPSISPKGLSKLTTQPDPSSAMKASRFMPRAKHIFSSTVFKCSVGLMIIDFLSIGGR